MWIKSRNHLSFCFAVNNLVLPNPSHKKERVVTTTDNRNRTTPTATMPNRLCTFVNEFCHNTCIITLHIEHTQLPLYLTGITSRKLKKKKNRNNQPNLTTKRDRNIEMLVVNNSNNTKKWVNNNFRIISEILGIPKTGDSSRKTKRAREIVQWACVCVYFRSGYSAKSFLPICLFFLSTISLDVCSIRFEIS